MTHNPKYNIYINPIEKYLKEAFGDNYIELKNTVSLVKNPDFTIIDLKTWSQIEKELLLLSSLKGIDYYIKNYIIDKNVKYSFPIRSYNSILNAINGNEEVEIYTKRIAHFNSEMEDLLIKKGYSHIN